MNSIIGRRPAIAAPTPNPAKPSSVIGLSITRLPLAIQFLATELKVRHGHMIGIDENLMADGEHDIARIRTFRSSGPAFTFRANRSLNRPIGRSPICPESRSSRCLREYGAAHRTGPRRRRSAGARKGLDAWGQPAELVAEDVAKGLIRNVDVSAGGRNPEFKKDQFTRAGL